MFHERLIQIWNATTVIVINWKVENRRAQRQSQIESLWTWLRNAPVGNKHPRESWSRSARSPCQAYPSLQRCGVFLLGLRHRYRHHLNTDFVDNTAKTICSFRRYTNVDVHSKLLRSAPHRFRDQSSTGKRCIRFRKFWLKAGRRWKFHDELSCRG